MDKNLYAVVELVDNTTTRVYVYETYDEASAAYDNTKEYDFTNVWLVGPFGFGDDVLVANNLKTK